MEAIGNLDGVRRALLAAFGICAGAIAHDDLNTGVMAQPLSEHVSGTIVARGARDDLR